MLLYLFTIHCSCVSFFFFKQKTAYEMRISDWSSDVCSSDLAGLLVQPEDGRDSYDRFRNRVIFPIADRRGRIIAFGGRILGEGEPKYLNSPETPLFHKGRVLYGLAQARRPAAERGELIVTEGYMDVIALSRAGFDAAVAPLGTALRLEERRAGKECASTSRSQWSPSH